MDRGAWWPKVYGVTESHAQLVPSIYLHILSLLSLDSPHSSPHLPDRCMCLHFKLNVSEIERVFFCCFLFFQPFLNGACPLDDLVWNISVSSVVDPTSLCLPHPELWVSSVSCSNVTYVPLLLYSLHLISCQSSLCLLAFFPWVGSVMTTLSHPLPYMCPQYYLQYPQETLSIVLPSRVLATKPLNQWSFQCYVQYPKAGQMLYGKLKIKPMFLK